jgi:hypothetical protein
MTKRGKSINLFLMDGNVKRLLSHYSKTSR